MSAPTSTSAPVTPRPASAVVLARPAGRTPNAPTPPDGVAGIEVFMVRRHVRSEFVPDAFVFPGGSVGPDDAAAETAPGLCDGAPDGPTTLGTGFRVAAIRECFEEAGVLLAMRQGEAAGFTPDDLPRLAALRAALNRHETTTGAIAQALGVTLATAELLRSSGPWGQAFPEPVFDGEFRLLDRRVVGNGHLKLVLEEGSGLRCEAIAFGTTGEHIPAACTQVRVAFKPDVNEYRGERKLQLLVEYIEPL